jgi:hypothetical protein
VCAQSHPVQQSDINPEVTVATQSSEPEASTPAAAKPSTGLSGRDLWEETRISPIEIAMPGGVGLTLRAYRLASELVPTEIDEEDDDPFEARERAALARRAEEEQEVIVDDEFAALVAEGDADREGKGATADSVEEPDPADFVDEKDEEAEQEEDEEVPIFLSHRGKLIIFKSPESLVSFIRSGAPHDLAQLDTWSTVAERVQSSDVDPLPEDRYELDLVVENLRGGHDSWDLPLLIKAGELGRDLEWRSGSSR